MTPSLFKTTLKKQIQETDIYLVKNDVLPFIKNPSDTDIWSTDYFLQLMELIKIDDQGILFSGYE